MADLAGEHRAAQDAFGEVAELLAEGAGLARAGRLDALESELSPRVGAAAAPVDRLARAAEVPECAVA